MAQCYNCGVEIPDDDSTRLCDSCKHIMLPFLKFVGASTSSSVRRLVSNEANLRSRGVTDSGMEYLLKICELQDRHRAAEQTEEEEVPQNVRPAVRQPQERAYSEVELPADEPLRVRRKPFGKFLPSAVLALVATGILFVIWFFVELFSSQHTVDVIPLFSGIACFCAAYVAEACRKTLDDVEEIKKRFR